MLNPKDFKTCFGISSKCEDENHVIFIDSDNIKYSDFVKDLLYLQNQYYLSDIYVLKTENGYNAFCLEKFKFNEVIKIINDISTSCKDHLRIGENRGYLTLRMSRSKQIISVIPKFTEIENELSLAHYLFFTEIMEYNLLNYDENKFDKLLKFDVVAYLSKKHGLPDLKIDNLDEEFDYTYR